MELEKLNPNNEKHIPQKILKHLKPYDISYSM